MKIRNLMATALMLAVAAHCGLTGAHAASIIFDDFNVDEGHFNLAPTFSGSNSNLADSSTADRITTDAIEGDGSQQLVFNMTSETAATRVRFLSGAGAAANNTAFATSAAEDGWIGMYLKTDSPDWTAQIWLEGASNNGSVPKTIIADGQWHLYEWNLDETTAGAADGWGDVAGIIGGSPVVADGNHTIDSILFRHTNPSPASATFLMDFVAKSESGSVGNLLPIPEPTSFALVGLIGLAAAGMRIRR